jgi:hypothetical protein
MARKCSSPGCAFSLPDKYPLEKCPWHLAPGKGPVKIAAAVAIAAAGFGGGMAYRKFRAYLREKDERKQRDARRQRHSPTPEGQQPTPIVAKLSATKSQKRPRTRKKSAPKSKRKTASNGSKK